MLSGATDAVGFLVLGGAFASVMTGNMVLAGLGLADGRWRLFATAATAIVAYVAGSAVGARIAGRHEPGDPAWPRPVTAALVLEAVLFVGYAGGYEMAGGGRPGAGAALVLLALTAAALGVQSTAVQRLGVPGAATTYLTGTLTTVVARLARRERSAETGVSVRLFVAVIAGAGAGGLLALHARPLAPVLQLLLLGVVLATASWAPRRAARPRHPAPDGDAADPDGAAPHQPS